MADGLECAEARDLFPELAAGVAAGDERARALGHLSGCPACRREFAATAEVIDELLWLVPEHDPPAGFESSVLARLTPAAPRRRQVDVVGAAAEAHHHPQGAGVEHGGGDGVDADDQTPAVPHQLDQLLLVQGAVGLGEADREPRRPQQLLVLAGYLAEGAGGDRDRAQPLRPPRRSNTPTTRSPSSRWAASSSR